MSSIDNRTDFSFPYPKPYEIQLNFMRALYKCLENKNIGIFESPTGTVILSFNSFNTYISHNNL